MSVSLFGFGVSGVGHLLGSVQGSGGSVVSSVAGVMLLRVVWVGDHFVALGLGVLVSQQLLDSDDQGEDESDLTDDQGLEGDEGEES